MRRAQTMYESSRNEAQEDRDDCEEEDELKGVDDGQNQIAVGEHPRVAAETDPPPGDNAIPVVQRI